MASYKKEGQANQVRKGQLWKNCQNGRIGRISGKEQGHRWAMVIGKKSHHVHEGTLLKFFTRLTA